MFDDLPDDLPRLETLRVWHTLWLARIDAKITAVQQRQTETEHGRRRRPEPPQWTVELGIGTGRPPIQIHAGDCHMAGKRRRPVGHGVRDVVLPTRGGTPKPPIQTTQTATSSPRTQVIGLEALLDLGVVVLAGRRAGAITEFARILTQLTSSPPMRGIPLVGMSCAVTA
ncbi:DUF6233 domain-containing protein [Streptomyces sp. NPDC002962]|uniref:DUF6233 domain-containing protein n=1 Tax=Streptomyces sp. NPDC002962 TaxID=3364674 RepID=UPI0036A2B100